MLQQLRYIYNIYPYMMDWILYIQCRLLCDDDLAIIIMVVLCTAALFIWIWKVTQTINV